ncbi:MAG: type II secretion system protein N [Alteromonadaceae bacterium]|nr:type II secretion system protein N [Alteromonadaceae bacterium]
MSVIKWIGLGFCAYLVFLVSELPANQVLSRVNLPQQLSIQGVSGSVWSGRAESIRYAGTTVFNAQWNLRFLPLLLGRASIDIKAGDRRDSDSISINGHISLSKGKILADNLQMYIPTDIVMANLAIPLPVNASGRFKVDINQLVYPQSCQELQGNGQWLNAGVAGTSGNIELGQFDATLACQEDKIAVKVAPPNKLGLDVTALVDNKGKISATGRFKVDPSLPQEVHVAASLFGDKDNDGFYSISL